MKGMKRLTALLCALMLVVSGCATDGSAQTEVSTEATTQTELSTEGTTSSEPERQTVTGVGNGRNGEIQVEVVFLGNVIESVTVKEHVETPIVSTPALDIVPEAIVANQTLKIDTVTGSTMTFNGILSAVEDAIQQAGLSVDDYQTVIEKTHSEKELKTDVLVIGAGGAGMSAAVEAAEQGAEVLLLEKLSSVGGSTELCLGIVATGAEEGNADGLMTAEEFGQQILNYNGGNEAQNEDMVKDFAAHINENADWLISKGFNGTQIQWSSTGPMSPEDVDGEFAKGWLLSTGVLEFGQGAVFSEVLKTAAEKAGVEILLNTAGTELIVDENNAVIGAKAHDAVTDTDYTIYANAVILATGGFGSDKEMYDEYKTICTYDNGLGIYMGGVGNTADGIRMAEAVGAKVDMFFTNGGIPGDNTVYATTGGVLINENAQVLDAEGNPIENLYSAGEMTDIVMMGNLYTICGTYNGWSIYTGRIAGRQAAVED